MNRSAKMDEQVGRDAARVFLIAAPAEEAFQIERPLLGRALKHVPVDGLWRSVGRNRVNPSAAGGVAVIAGANQGHLAEFARLDNIAGLVLQHRADALAADLEHLAAFLDSGDDFEALVDGVSEGLLAVNVFASFKRFDHMALVEMVGRGDRNGVDRVIGQNFTVVANAFRFAAGALNGALNTPRIGVADRNDFLTLDRLDRLQQLLSARSNRNHADPDAVMGADGCWERSRGGC
jgi:hypothetical protein